VEISNDSAAAKMLAFTVVAMAKVGKPNLLEGLKVILADWENFLMNDPVHHISAGRVSERTLVVIERINFVCRRLGESNSLIRQLFLNTSNLWRSKSVEKFSEAYLFNEAKIKWAELLNEGVTVVSFLE
jgi:hypothetical protein